MQYCPAPSCDSPQTKWDAATPYHCTRPRRSWLKKECWHGFFSFVKFMEALLHWRRTMCKWITCSCGENCDASKPLLDAHSYKQRAKDRHMWNAESKWLWLEYSPQITHNFNAIGHILESVQRNILKQNVTRPTLPQWTWWLHSFWIRRIHPLRNSHITLQLLTRMMHSA